VIYLGHVPYGFFEEQMMGFFSQFGEITNLRLARNRKTGKSKHYAFIEFAQADVAQIGYNFFHYFKSTTEFFCIFSSKNLAIYLNINTNLQHL
jgi:RNA recognition motif-containing protein